MLDVVTFKWRSPRGYRSTFSAEHVNTLAAMVARHLPLPHRFTCITDDAEGIASHIRVLPLWDDFASVPSPHGANQPSCYRRLKLFAPDAAEWMGERILCLDLDCIITGDMTPLVDRPEDFVAWGDTHPKTPYNGSMWLLKTGARPKVWTDFDPARSPAIGRKLGYLGSDQAWISACLGPREPKWTTADGVYSYRCHIAPRGNALPSNARIVVFHGAVDPWGKKAQAMPWVREHYRGAEPHRLRRCLVLGGAASVFDDAERVLEMAEFDAVIATNDAGAHWSGRLDQWATLHPEKLPRWERDRRTRGYPGGYVRWSHAEKPHIDRVTMDWRGSSGLFAVKVALELRFDRVVLCGVPMAADGAHFFDAAEWAACRGYLNAWNTRHKELAGRVRSMSGWTARLLGEVDEGWLSGR